jgi:pimeloyl-ACP methyl ester carboxylesterase
MGYSHSSETARSNHDARLRVSHARSVGRFRETRKVTWARNASGLLCRVAPGLAGHLTYALLAKPPRAPERAWQHALREEARTTWLPLALDQIAVYDWGKGPTVLMVHGWGARATHLGRLIKPLVDAGYRVVAFDAPAHGHSTGSRTDLVAYAAAVAAVARHAGPVHTLLAHSFGVAMALYARRDWGVQANRQVLISSFDHCKWFVEAFGQYAGMTTAVLDRARQMMVDLYQGRLDWDRLSVVEMLRSAPQPTLIIHDREDGEIPFAHSLALMQAAPHARFYATSGLGHHRLLGNSDVARQIVDFVSGDAPPDKAKSPAQHRSASIETLCF